MWFRAVFFGMQTGFGLNEEATTLRGGGVFELKQKKGIWCVSSEACESGNGKKATAVVTQNGC